MKEPWSPLLTPIKEPWSTRLTRALQERLMRVQQELEEATLAHERAATALQEEQALLEQVTNFLQKLVSLSPRELVGSEIVVNRALSWGCFAIMRALHASVWVAR
jgi:hypothetical protein